MVNMALNVLSKHFPWIENATPWLYVLVGVWHDICLWHDSRKQSLKASVSRQTHRSLASLKNEIFPCLKFSLTCAFFMYFLVLLP